MPKNMELPKIARFPAVIGVENAAKHPNYPFEKSIFGGMIIKGNQQAAYSEVP